MTHFSTQILLSLAVLLLASACQPDTDDPSQQPGNAAPLDLAQSQSVQFLELEGWLPDNWAAQTPSSNMRLAQYQVPGIAPAADAEFIIFYFGPGQGGTPAANIARWQSQFSSATGEPVEPEVSLLSANGMPATFVSLTGNYARGVGMGAETATPDQTLLAAIVESSQGNLYVQFHGPSATVNKERHHFIAFVTGLRPTTP